MASLAQFTREAVSTLDRQKALVPPSAVILTRDEQENPEKRRPLIRFFVSYAHDDDERVQKLQSSLEKELAVSKRYRFEVWTDRKIDLGADWDDAIQRALAECDFGLLFISRDFLGISYITGKELPPFISGTKPKSASGKPPRSCSSPPSSTAAAPPIPPCPRSSSST